MPLVRKASTANSSTVVHQFHDKPSRTLQLARSFLLKRASQQAGGIARAANKPVLQGLRLGTVILPARRQESTDRRPPRGE